MYTNPFRTKLLEGWTKPYVLISTYIWHCIQ